jgi:ATP-dependent exoDNAse (exonuclease V) beta subunit
VAALQGSAFALSDGALGMLARKGDFAKNALFEPPPESFDEITRERLDRFRATVRYVTALGTRPLAESCRAIVVASGAELARASDSETAAQARANLDQFVRFAADLSRDLPRATLRDLIAELDEREALELDLPIAELAGDRVSLVTIHGAKGLEWKHVFVVDVAPSAFPIVTNDMREVVAYLSDRGALAIKMGVDGRPTLRWFSGRFEPDERGVVVKRDPDYEEEHRLFYVALTRARDSITITGRTDRYGNASTCIKAVRAWLSSSGFDEGDHGVADSPEFTALPFASSASTIDPQQLQLLLHRSERSGRDDAAPERVGPLSFSAMELQERCPRRARYHYVFGLPDLEDVDFDVDVDTVVQEDLPKRDPGRFGRIVHKILEYDAKARIAETERDLERFIADAVEEEEGTSAEAEAARSAVAAARAVLETYEPVAAEQRFLLSIGGEVMSGYIDLLARDRDGRLIVIDYKTGSTAGEHYALQFALYARAVREIYEEQPNAMLLRIGEQTAMAEAIAIASDAALYAAIEAAGTMENNEPRPSAACRYCPYAYDVCDAAPRPELSGARS